MEDEEKPAWVGAKKFSMKDRYTETVIDSENISKILPHRYVFVLFVNFSIATAATAAFLQTLPNSINLTVNLTVL
jgi:hypothetical protein